ncbi:lipid-binding SYLF domain-containing protein [Desulfovibrio oxyclinae]|uniref:lipid-binding SYLF domain-containing protein n=1 Tax=Desulfovibrio oxyclinae TaxID=63560 RepID=UPI000477709A|nr:lipid-binding SYLF domain-containing protein [Desulfovibrio oxyclinae]
MRRVIIRASLVLTCMVLVASLGLSGCAAHKPPKDHTESVASLDAKAARTLERFLDKDPQHRLRDYLRTAHAVFVIPTYGKAAFIFSIRGGSGALAVRDEHGKWQGPVFYSIGAPGVGMQAGVRLQSVVFAFRTPESLENFMEHGTIGGASFAVEFLDAGFQDNAKWDDPDPEMLVVTELSGLYAGAGVEAGVLNARPELNAALWGDGVDARQILEGKAGKRETAFMRLLEGLSKPEMKKGETEVSPKYSSGVSEGT